VKLFYVTKGGLKGEASSDSAFIYVRSVLPEDASDIRPLKPNTPAPSELAWYVIIGAVVCLLVACSVILFRILRKRREPEEEVVQAPPRPAHELAFEELERIQDLGLVSQGRFKLYYSLISEAIRRYVGNRFGFDTMDLTTAELLNEMRKRGIKASVDELKVFLVRCDLVKFAKLVPPYDEIESAVETARGLVRRMMESDSKKVREEDTVNVGDGQ
jgi:hypothetical protein